MFDALLPDVGGWLAGVVVVLVGLLAAWRGRKLATAEKRADEAEAHIETRKEIEDAVEASHAGGAAWHDRLRAHSDAKR